MNESPSEPTTPASQSPPPRSDAKQRLLVLSLLAIIGSAFYSMWQTTLDLPVLPESHVQSIKAAFTWNPVDREARRILAAEKRATEAVARWIQEPHAFFEHALKNDLREPSIEAEIQNSYRRIRDRYREFLKRYPEHVPARLAYGDFLELVEDYDGATEAWDLAREIDPKNPEIWSRQARIAYFEENFEKLLTSYQRAIQLDEGNWDHHYQMATIVFSNLGKSAQHFGESAEDSLARAILHYTEALRFNPTHSTVAHELAMAYAHSDPPRIKDSIAAWEKSARHALDDIDRESAYLHIADVLIGDRQFDDARKHVERSSLPTFRGQREWLLRKISHSESQ